MRDPLPDRLERCRVTGTRDDAPSGTFELPGPCGERLTIVAAAGTKNVRWERVSVMTRKRNPNWREMSFVKELFWNDDECVVQFHPPKSEYVTTRPHCLHLWRPVDGKFPMPPRGAV